MDQNLAIALLCGVVSMLLSVTMPCLLKKTQLPLLDNVKLVFNNNRHVIIVSSLVVALTAYLALSLYPLVSEDINEGEKMTREMMLRLLGK
jgi:phosphotransferase system  glucose/maltose/N-acetylglucosamine-specific IIC component